MVLTGKLYASEQVVLRTPSLSPDGKTIVFSYQGDIWSVPSTGGNAVRLTVHPGYDSNPLFSPNGEWIAFISDRYGNNDLFVMSAKGGTPKQITFHSASDNLASWKGNDELIFTTSREYRQIERNSEVYSVPVNGGTEQRISNAFALDPSYSPDGVFLAFVKGDINPVVRKDYRGSSNREIWLFNTKKNEFNKLDLFTTNDIYPQWISNRTFLFMSSDAGNYNIYQVMVDDSGKLTGSPKKLTSLSSDQQIMRSFNVSPNGETLVFEQGDGIYLMKKNGAEFTSPTKISVQILADNRTDDSEFKTYRNAADDYALSPNGKYAALVIRGEVFITQTDKEKSRSVNVSQSPFRDYQPSWLNDSVLIFVSDRFDSNFEIVAVKSTDKNETDLFKSLKHEWVRLTNTPEDESSLVVSNAGDKVAYMLGRGTLLVSEISSDLKLKKTTELHNGWASAEGMAWSPDDKWLAYSMPDLEFNDEVFIHAADNSQKPVNVTMHPRSDFAPFWSADGSKLGFVSARNNRNDDIWFVWLKQEDYDRSKSDWEDYEKPKEKLASSKDDKKSKKDKKDEKPAVKPIQIDFKDIHKRLVQVTSISGDENYVMISSDGETIYYTAENTTAEGKRDLFSVKWNGEDNTALTSNGTNPYSLKMDKEGKNIYYFKSNGNLSRLDVKTKKSEAIPYSASMQIDYKAERAQVFDEAWRTLRDGFYDPNFHGKDWNQLRTKYRDLAISASIETDFAEIMNYMLGELNASHMRFTSPDREETQDVTTGLLGVELEPVKDGMKVNHVIPASPASKKASQLFDGDVIQSVNGVPVSNGENFYNLLNGTVDTQVLLSVLGTDKKSREVVIRPVSSLRSELYQEWVDNRKALVEKWSNGKLGYIHVQGMNMPSFEVYERELTASGYGKDGIIIDVRYNGGGFTTDYLMTTLTYQQHAYTIPRGAAKDLEKEKLNFRPYYPIGERLVYAAWTKPSVAMCNEGSYSNAEIFSHAYKSAKLGDLVGLPTNGSVISTGGRRLLDGSFVRLPFRAWFTKATDLNQEVVGPAIPTVEVANQPDWQMEENDAQLKKAVEKLLEKTRN